MRSCIIHRAVIEKPSCCFDCIAYFCDPDEGSKCNQFHLIPFGVESPDTALKHRFEHCIFVILGD